MIEEKVQNEKIGMMIFTETHLSEDHFDAEIDIKGFEQFRTDRTGNTKRGGVITYVRDDLAPGSTIRLSASVGNIEYLVLDVPAVELTLIGIYRPPLSNPNDFETVINNIAETIEDGSPTLRTLVFTGDLNFPIINWELNEIYGGSASDRRQALLLLEFFE